MDQTYCALAFVSSPLHNPPTTTMASFLSAPRAAPSHLDDDLAT